MNQLTTTKTTRVRQ